MVSHSILKLDVAVASDEVLVSRISRESLPYFFLESSGGKVEDSDSVHDANLLSYIIAMVN
jgi:hypothetical protein